jgi:hypothetical protein
MATKGLRPGPFLQPFDCIDHKARNCVYLIELTNNTVKVGRSSRPRDRLAQLCREARGAGHDIDRFMVQVLEGVRCSVVESLCIAALSAECEKLPGRHEYFSGLGYDRALEIFRSVLTGTHIQRAI